MNQREPKLPIGSGNSIPEYVPDESYLAMVEITLN